MQTTAPYTPKQNGIAEWYNHTVVELGHAMLYAHNLPGELWPEAINHACYIRNQAYTQAISGATPYEKWTGNRPNVLHIQEFGVPVWVLDKSQKNKLQPRSSEHLFVGYEDGPKVIKYFDIKTCYIKVSHNYHFPLTRLPTMAPEHQLEGKQCKDDNSKSDAILLKCKDTPDINETPIKRYKNSNMTQDASDEYIPDLIDNPDSDKPKEASAEWVYAAFTECDMGEKDPKTLKEAMESPNWPKWKKAIQTKLDTLEKMGTWKLADMPKDRKPVTNKWVFIRKYNKDGRLLKYKARLVARGFSQVPGMDYNKMFAPVIQLEMIQMILSLAVEEDWEIQQMDVKGAYLNSNLKEEIYMNQPEGFKDKMSRLCHLIKTIYGLKQSGREWNHKLHKNLHDKGFEWLQSDPCVYI